MNTANIKKLGQNIKHDNSLLLMFLELLTELKTFISEHKELPCKSTLYQVKRTCTKLKSFLIDNNCINDFKTENKFNKQLKEYETNINIIDNKSNLYLKLEKCSY